MNTSQRPQFASSQYNGRRTFALESNQANKCPLVVERVSDRLLATHGCCSENGWDRILEHIVFWC